jgi:nitrite reductase/ring-hydroxylating ferredoxin subunit
VRSSLSEHENQHPVTLLAASEIADGGLAAVDAVVQGSNESLILHRDGDAVRAWLNICPHAGRRLDWAPGEFLRTKDGMLVCAAHGATFELGEGLCVGGPCRGQFLRTVAVEVRDGRVRLAPEALRTAG